MKLFSYGSNQALFAVLADGRYKHKYDKNNPEKTFGVVAVDLADIDENSTIYKLGSMKSTERNKFKYIDDL